MDTNAKNRQPQSAKQDIFIRLTPQKAQEYRRKEGRRVIKKHLKSQTVEV